MAMPLRVPREHEGGFAKIRDLDDESAQELLAALQKLPATINPDSLISAVAAAMADTIAASDVEEMVPALLFLYSARDATGASASDIAEGIARGMERVVSRELRSSPEYREPFQARLVELLSADSPSVIARAGNLSMENEHTLRYTRVITDIRPVFEQEDPKATPRAAAIIHTLKISYSADNQTKNFFVMLDDNDISELLEQLERANSKAESLRAILRAAQVPIIGVD
jgi:hypothetical protein